MGNSREDTIAAIVTPVATGGLGVVRISGERARGIFSQLFISSNGPCFESHRMLHGWLYSHSDKQKIDQIMACFMQSPRSYTGEDVVEFFCHGSVAVLEEALGLALKAGARLAQRGEFTKRAFLNGKIDLAQAEGVLDLVGSRTLEGAGYAIQQLDGRLSKIVKDLRKQVLDVLAEVEGEIDFPDDFPQRDYYALQQRIGNMLRKIDKILAGGVYNRIFRDGISVVIAGKPNVGKSSLLNALLNEDRAIVTNVPGTTRDSIEEAIHLNGLPLKLIDTAGIGKPGGEAEKFGIGRAQREISAAELLLIVLDGSEELNDLDLKIIETNKDKNGIFVVNKIDIAMSAHIRALEKDLRGRDVFAVSAKTKKGIDELTQGIYNILRKRFFGQANSITLNARHRECFIKAREALARAIESSNKNMPVDFISIDLKEAVLSLGEITGELVSEEIINTIFEQFCVGK